MTIKQSTYLPEIERFTGPVTQCGVVYNKNMVVYLVDGNYRRYALKIYSDFNNCRNNEAEIINSLEGIGYFHVPKIVAAFDWGTLFDYLEGYENFAGNGDSDFITELDPVKSNLPISEFIRNMLSESLQYSSLNKGIDKQFYRESRSNISISRVGAIKNQSIIIDANYQKKIINFLLEFPLEKYQLGCLTHGDFRFHNILVKPYLDEYKIIDWEFGDYSNKNRDYATLMLYLVCQDHSIDLSLKVLSIIETLSDFNYDLLH